MTSIQDLNRSCTVFPHLAISLFDTPSMSSFSSRLSTADDGQNPPNSDGTLEANLNPNINMQHEDLYRVRRVPFFTACQA
jgi:hypothetical protein